MTFRIEFTPTAIRMLEEIADRRLRELIFKRIEELASEPEKLGKALTDELAGYRSLRAAGQRYRVVYRVERDRVLVLVVAIGRRKEGARADIYELARKLLKFRLV